MARPFVSAITLCCVVIAAAPSRAQPAPPPAKIAEPSTKAPEYIHVPLPGASLIHLVTHRPPDRDHLTTLSGDQRLASILAALHILTSDWTTERSPAAQTNPARPQSCSWNAGGEVKPHWQTYPTIDFHARQQPANISIDLDEIRKLGGLKDARADSTLAMWGLSNSRNFDLALVSNTPSPTGSSIRLSLEIRSAPRSIPPEGDHERSWTTLSSDAKLPPDIQPLAQATAWHTWLQVDARGLGSIGPRGGAGSLAGLLRMLAESRYLLGPESDATWTTKFATWRSASDEAIRVVNQSVRQEVLLAGVATANAAATPAAQGLLLLVPLRETADPDRVLKSLTTLAEHMGLTSTWRKSSAGSSIQGVVPFTLAPRPEAANPAPGLALHLGLVKGPEGKPGRFIWLGLQEVPPQESGKIDSRRAELFERLWAN